MEKQKISKTETSQVKTNLNQSSQQLDLFLSKTVGQWLAIQTKEVNMKT